MKKTQFDPKKIIGDGILDLDRQGLCEFIVKLCESVKADAGAGVYRGGVFPENISVDDGGNVAVGAARKEDWDGQELEFLPPELYWNRRPSPASDVYSIGLIMYYALSGGRLPFEELLARIRAALRRAGPAANLSAFTTGELTIDYDKHLVTLAGQPVHLTANEYRLVELLSRSAGKVLTYDRISEAMWGDAAGGNSQLLRVNMANIRRKLEQNPAEPQYILTEIGVGYRMKEPG